MWRLVAPRSHDRPQWRLVLLSSWRPCYVIWRLNRAQKVIVFIIFFKKVIIFLCLYENIIITLHLQDEPASMISLNVVLI